MTEGPGQTIDAIRAASTLTIMLSTAQPLHQIESALESLRASLGRNLYSCMLYGSAVRGDLVAGWSDLNFLIVLEESTPEAHEAISGALRGFPSVSPLVVGRRELARTFRAFATKFRSIQRHHRVLHGASALDGLIIDAEQERFLVEQALRNHSLRLTHGFITGRANDRRFTRFLLRHRTGILSQLSEALRLSSIEVPDDRNARLPIVERELKVDVSILRELGQVKQEKRVLRTNELATAYTRLLELVRAALGWIEVRWPTP